jgi:multidrug efflux pump subunit AcrA (membrane-fusion protein)
MSEQGTIPWTRRPDLVERPVGEAGQHVIKDPRTGSFYNLGEQEWFLLSRLDGRQTGEAIREAFEARFGQPLSEEDLREFLDMVQGHGFLQPADGATPAHAQEATPPPAGDGRPAPPPPPAPARAGQSILYWRKSLFDPDALLTRLAPWLWFLWTPAFVAFSLAGVALAVLVLAANWQHLVSSFAHTLRWETLALVWLTLLVATLCHEFAHGLTCKHHGGEVHEIGFLLLFFMPCFYCNVSDAWLFREKSKRLAVTLAGGYWDLCLWALAVFAWRLTVEDGLLNYLALVVLSVLGSRVFLNFNPFLKLDGYYLLSDWLEIPNLQPRALGYLMGRLRSLLWGAPAPSTDPRGGVLLAYGTATWLFGLGFLAFMIATAAQFLGDQWGPLGIAAALLLGAVVLRASFRGFLGGEVSRMVLTRPKRAALWTVALAAVAAAVVLVRVEDRAGGTFQVRPAVLAEVRAPAAGFLREVYVEEGSRVAAGARVARLEVPNLATRIVQKHAEVRELEARLRLLEAGPRPEEVAVHRQRVERALTWRGLAEQDLRRAQKAHGEDVARLDRQIAQYRAERNYARGVHARAQGLLARGAASAEECREAEKKALVLEAQLGQAEAQKRVRIAEGVCEAEAELARRERELAEARAALGLLEAGSRPEEVEAMRALLARSQEDARSLEELQERAVILSPAAGLVTTPRLGEKVGQYFREGELICAVEEASALEAEIVLADQEVAEVRPGQVVQMKVRALPLQAFHARVERIAPRAVRGDVQSTLTVYCRLEDPHPALRPGMLGYAHISCGRRPIATILGNRVLRLLRTEFWW